MLVVERLSQSPVEVEVHTVVRADVREDVQLPPQPLVPLVGGRDRAHERGDRHRVRDHPDQHQHDAEQLLRRSLARDVSVPHSRDGRDNEVERRDVLLA